MTDARASAVGAPWLGTLKADWPLVPLRYLVSFLSGGTPDKGNPQFWSGGTIPWVSPKDMKIDRIDDAEDHITESALDGSATQLVPVGSVLVVVRGMILAHTLPVAVTTGPLAINQDIKALVCGPRVLPEFLHAVLVGQAEWLLSLTNSSAHGTKKLETEVLQRFEVPCPPLEVQKRIVATMRARAADLDELTAAKQRALDLLDEKRKVIIATASTRGLDPTSRLRDSGVPWLGEIPAHWTLHRLKFLLTRIEQGWSPDCYGVPANEDEWGVLRAGCCNGGTFNEIDNKALPIDLDPRPELEVAGGDLLMSRASGSADLIGSAALVPSNARRKLMLSDKVYRLVVDERRAVPSFLALALNSPVARWQISGAISGASGLAKNIAQSDVAEILVPTPLIDEQRAIVEHVARESARLDAVWAATERTITLLKERRAALVAAAVIGQIDTEQQHEQEVSARYSHAAARRNKEQSR